MNEPPTAFHSSVRSVVLCAAPLGVAFGMALILIHDGFVVDWRNWRALVIAILAGIVGVVLQSYVACRLYSVEITRMGIRAYSFWGSRRFIEWEQIDALRPARFLNLRYLRLYSRHHQSPVWVALFYPNYSDFRRALTERAPSGSPILLHV